ncbi:MAG TPA: GumC family protein, partial [Terriglobales bacterium]|nr:GumC family protein [Terriglobales bacterium]
MTRLPLPENEPAIREASGPIPLIEEEALTLRRLYSVLRRRVTLITGVAFLITALAALFVYQITPLYRADVDLVVDGSRQKVVNAESVVQSVQSDYWTNETEAAVMASREMARKAVEKLNLVNNPMFNPELRRPEKGLFGTVFGPAREFISATLVAPIREAVYGPEASETQPAVTAPMTAEEKREALIDQLSGAFLGGLSVTPHDRSRVLTVTYTSTDPAFAALAANTVSELYILDQLAAKGDATSRASKWLSERVNEMRRRVIDSEQRLEEFRRTAGIVEVGGATLFQQQLVGLNEELIQARNKRAETEARYEQVQAMLKSGGDAQAIAAVLDSRLIQGLREQEAMLERKIADLSQQYLPTHPKLKQAQQELAAARAKIESEVSKISVNQDNELKIARTREANVTKEARRLEQLLEQQKEAEVTLRSLESEVRANKQLYETLLSRFKETSVARDDLLQQADARIISRAAVPGSPFYPKRGLMIAAAFVVSIVIGIALALVAEYLDSGFHNLNQIEAMTGQPTIGLVPSLGDLQKLGKRPHEVALDRPNSA